MSHIHKFIEAEFKGYEKCTDCGSYHSIAQVDPKVIYEEKNYWGDGTGRSTLEQQVENFNCIDDCGISKADRIFQFVPNGNAAIEIACAPGVLLNRFVDKGYVDVFGIEPSVKYIDFICNQAPKSKVINGYFPEATQPFKDNLFDCIVGSDVMEHCDNYDAYFKEAHRILKVGGTMITMSPIILTDGLYRKIDFDFPDQHCWIHSQTFLEPYLKEMFSHVEFRRWICGHELIICKK